MAEKAVAFKEKSAPAAKEEGALHPFESFRNEMDRLFDSFFAGRMAVPTLVGAFPPMESVFGKGVGPVRFDVAEDDKAFEVTAEVPGMEEKDVEVTIADGVLRMKGEKKVESEKKNKNYYLSERRYGAFERAFRLPDTVDEDKIKASFKNGVVTVTLPKKAGAAKAAKKIAVSKG